MKNTRDSSFLKSYARRRSQPAFRELMHRHVDLVYAACLRQVRDPNLAEEVTQVVFIILANKAATLGPDVELAGWLIKTARYASMTALRAAARRRKHEQEAAAMTSEITMSDPAAELWEQIAPVLDAALAKLNDADRSAIVLRFMQEKPYEQIADALKISPEAARQRISRARGRLRKIMLKLGVSAAPESLMIALPIGAAVHAPVGLVETLTGTLALPGQASVAVARSTMRAMQVASWQMVGVGLSLLVVVSAATLAASLWLQARTPLPPVAAAPAVTTLVTSIDPAASDVTAQLVDPEGRPISNAEVSVVGGRHLVRSDSRGFFTLTGPATLAKKFESYSQKSRRMGLFLRNTDGSLPPHITLQYSEASVDGMVVDVTGKPVGNVMVNLTVLTPDGTSYLLESLQTNGVGYYSASSIPGGPDLKVIATLSSSPDGRDTTGPIAMRGPWQMEMPDLISKTLRGKLGAAAFKRTRYSGRVIDAQGKRIAGAELRMDYSIYDRNYSAGSVMTEADGSFSRLLPTAAHDATVTFRLTHPDFVADSSATPSVEKLTTGTAVFVMKPALSLTGTVHDSKGLPIENALVLAGDSYDQTGGYQEPIEDCTSPRTDKQGRFIAKGLSAGSRAVVVSSDEFVPVRLNINVSADTKPLDVMLDHGVFYTAKLVDVEGKAIAGGNVVCNEWNVQDKGSPHLSSPLARFTKTAADGSFTLANLPETGWLELYASAPAGTQLAGMNFNWSVDVGPRSSRPGATTEPGTQIHDSITLYPYPVIKGSVVDADTGNPILKFKLTPGWDTGSGFSKLDFHQSKAINPGNGSFSKRIDGFAPQMGIDCTFQVEISADGYARVLSPSIRLGEVHAPFVIKLKRVEPK